MAGSTTGINSTPWDKRALGIDTFEIVQVDEEIFRRIQQIPGHYTIKVDPLASKQLLHQYGFYYCDSLLEPYCRQQHFVFHQRDDITISRQADVEAMLRICDGAFAHGRFHRDFHIDKRLADVRYNNWLRDLCQAGNCFGLFERQKLAGFFAFNSKKIVLHALSDEYRGKGLAKYFWSVACRELFAAGHDELTSSVSATNAAIVNLYASLGFRFRKPCDVYHLLVKELYS